MHPKKFALYGGIVMLLFGAIALVPNLVGSTETLPALQLENSYGLFLGIFPMNILNKLALVLFGIAGIIVSQERFTNLPASIHYSRWVFFVMGAAAILGAFPQTNTLYGYWPLFGNEVWAHGIFAALGAYFGFALTAKVPDSGEPTRTFKTPMPSHR